MRKILLTSAAFMLLATPAMAATTGETWERYDAGTWAQGSTHGGWHVRYDGYGRAAVREIPTDNQVLELRPTVNPPGGIGTSAIMVHTEAATSGDVTVTANMRTLSQNARFRVPRQTPNAWETAWLWWNLDYRPGSGDEGTGKQIDETAHGYYVALKPNGWEVGKVDQARFIGGGGQRYLATGTSPRFPVSNTWHTVRVEQRQVDATHDRIKVWVDGQLLTTVVDGPGSGGYPGWGAHPSQEVYRSGHVGLYNEDARTQVGNLTIRTP